MTPTYGFARPLGVKNAQDGGVLSALAGSFQRLD